MSGTNAGRIVPASELIQELAEKRYDENTRHRFTAAHPVARGELIEPGFDSIERLAEYYSGLIDGIVYAENLNIQENI